MAAIFSRGGGGDELIHEAMEGVVIISNVQISH